MRRKRVREGVTVRMLSEITPQNFRVAKVYSDSVHLKHVANLGRSLRYLVIDNSELVLAGTATGSCSACAACSSPTATAEPFMSSCMPAM